jgi:hypothetical protein
MCACADLKLDLRGRAREDRRVGMISTVGLVLQPRRACSDAIDTISTWAKTHSASVLGLAQEVGRISADARSVDSADLAARTAAVVEVQVQGHPSAVRRRRGATAAVGRPRRPARPHHLLSARATPTAADRVGRGGVTVEAEWQPDGLTGFSRESPRLPRLWGHRPRSRQARPSHRQRRPPPPAGPRR